MSGKIPQVLRSNLAEGALLSLLKEGQDHKGKQPLISPTLTRYVMGRVIILANTYEERGKI